MELSAWETIDRLFAASAGNVTGPGSAGVSPASF
jgi:uncharacterized membrane protein YbhN (UPF0104 family)